MDITETIQANSDQLNADDLVAGPIVARITEVRRGPSKEQPVQVHLTDTRPWRPWRPSKTSRRVLAAAWGTDTAQWTGRWVRLFRDDTVTWGGKAVGGIRIAALSDIPRALTLQLAIRRGQKQERRIEALTPPVAPVLNLADILDDAGISPREFDSWLESRGKPRIDERTDEQLQQIASWLAAHPDVLESMRGE